ncbi:putative transcriptional regulator protein, LysR family [Rubellimicrobium mesophilum DSM 19309]|uniref:Putative transcriptional regulator protein, LysR family n=1 Tax=Rubellimicrobium mesophilum DSM 19309 TaxID=442562 RepID=A0A017HUG5_9RHOB|nr:LysR substrate-binding domain-containing protein [Rubellimicrobium mesophilum]EYD78011.1 putative transcriptional regulator protein, LysR family [Rubellimicrobium mesophilum DSM 19309]
MPNPLNRVPLQSLRAVEAVARLGTLRAAAEDLGVTPGAVSQQVIRAEQVLGRALFDRQPSGMVPSGPSAEVLALLRRGFADLTAAVARAAPQGEDCLTVSVAPILASRWLIWRLPKFRAAHPAIRVRIDADLALTDPGAEIDLCVRVGRGHWPGVRAERLAPQVIFPVCAPDMAVRLRDHADLARVPIIRETRANFGWEDWLGPEGRLDVVPGDGPLFSDAQLCLDAAISGEGVFLTFESLAADPLAMGRLAEPFKGRHATPNAYWIVTPADGSVRRPVRAFIDWLRAEFAGAGLGATRPPG